MSSVQQVRWREYGTLFYSRSLSWSFSNPVASKSIPLPYVSLTCFITLLKQTTFQISLTSICRNTSRLDSTDIFWLYLSKIFITGFVIVQFDWYNISTRQFSKNGLVVQSNCLFFYLFCCLFEKLFVYSSFTGMHHSCCPKICVQFVANKAHHFTKR